VSAKQFYPDLEARLLPLATRLRKPRPGDWLAEHPEPGQTFEEYLAEHPVHRTETFNAIYLCLVGDFAERQQQVLQLTQEYMNLFFDMPVKITERVPLASIPREARRKHPSWGDSQVLSGYILREVLLPMRPTNALAYLAFTSSDLWPGEGWNFVFGEASLKERIGVWSIYRNGDPDKGEEGYRVCVQRTLATATHETCHILTMWHCTAFQCMMNGSNHQEERDSRPLHLCPVCLRKLCWNLQVEPVQYLKKLGAFWREQGFHEEAGWYGTAVATLEGGPTR
jgi:archaemetzincin